MPVTMERTTRESTRMLSTLMLLLVNLGLAYQNPDVQTSFSCPRECENCALLSHPTSGIMVYCDLNKVFLIRDDLSYIQSPQIRWLTLTCSEEGSHVTLSDRSFSGMPNLMEVVINGCAIRDISRSLFMTLRNLYNLKINGLGVSARLSPGWIQPMKNSLRYLDMSNNGIIRFPTEQFCGVSHLQTLLLSHNRLSSSQSLGIKCNSKGTEQTPCHPCLPSITYLDLSSNEISFLSVDFRVDLPQLQILDISGNSLLSILPRIDVILVGSLQSLDLSHNKLSTFLLKDFNDCNGSVLSHLHVKNNNLKYISPDFFRCFTKLQSLDLAENSLNGVSLHKAGLFQLRKLKWLHLSSNRIDQLNFSMFENMTELLEFSCTGCGLEAIGKDTFSNAQNLETLRLKNNSLKYIEGSTFTHLKRLNILDLTQNQLSIFEMDSGIPSLTQLHLGGNLLLKIPDFSAMWSGLILLDLIGNNINEIQPEKLYGLSHLNGLRISYNNISYIPGYAFSTMKRLGVLNLARNGILSIEYSAFQGLDSLTHLKLEGNRIQEMDVYLIPLIALQRLYLSGNLVQSIRQKDLPVSLQYLDLSGNMVSFIEYEAFINLDHLLAVNLTHNKLGSLAQPSLRVSPKVWLRPQFFLRWNWLECDCDMEWLRTINTYRLAGHQMALVTDLDMVGCSTRIASGRLHLMSRDPSDMLCTYPDQCLIWECHCCYIYNTTCSCRSYCFPECTCFRNRDLSINTMDCTSKNITSPLPVKRPFLAKQLSFDDNNLPRLKASDFTNFPYMKYLLLNKSHVSYIEPFAFSHLNSMTHLYLQDNAIRQIDSLMFHNVSILEELHLQNNRLESLESNSFQELTSLKVLLLHQNNLNFIDMSIFDSLVALEKVALYANPWECDCQFGLTFQRWLFANSKKVLNPKQILCTFIPPLNETTEQDLSLGPFGIYSMNTTLVTKALMDIDFHFCRNATIRTIVEHQQRYMIAGVVSIAAIFVALFILIGILYYFRLLIRVWAYNHYGIRFRLGGEDEDNDDKPYDVFIAHGDADRDFVLDELLPKLEEGDMAYKSCVADRDWLGDKSIPESVVASIQQSKRTLLIVSENSFTTQWCKYIFDTALYYVLNDKQLRLIVVLMKDTLRMRTEPEIELFLKTDTYLVYDNPWFWRKLRYYLPDNPRGGDGDTRPLDVNRGRTQPDG